jgi:predicted kinase
VVLPEEKERARQRATAYYQLARAYAQSRQSQLILMAGLSGSGKTTVARHLAQKIGAIHIRSDAVRKQMAGIPLHQRGSIPGNYRGGIYTPEMTHRTYKRLLELGIFLARHELSVILDAKYDRHELRWEAITQAQTNQIPIKIFYCTAPLEVLRHRLQTRTGDIADATADILIEQQKEMEPFTEAEQNYVKVLDTTQDLNTQIA